MPKEREVTFEEMKGRKLKIQKVDVSKWFEPGSAMWVREVSAAEAMEFAEERKGVDDTEDADWGVFAASVCHKNGSLFFPKGQVIKRSDIPAALFQRLVLAAVKLNHIGEDDAAKN